MANPAPAISLPATEAPLDRTVERLRRRSRRVESVIAAVVVLFAFLLASFAVRNADFWLHLATGRLIAEGRYQFGVDPFGIGTEGVRWVNHSWLFDWLLYQSFRLLGDGVVVAKGLLVALLAAVMMAVRRREHGLFLPAVCGALAILVAGPRLLFQPMLVSFLFLATTVYLLASGKRRRAWLIVPLFVFWVNLDAWFLLGPLTVAAFAAADRRRLRMLAVGLAACLLNPHNVYAFQLPMELSPGILRSPLLDDVRFERLFESPWRLARYRQSTAGLNAAGLAYFLLLGLGVVSFMRCRPALRDWRLPLWLLFAALGAFQLRLVPFFAVVAGPVTALNLQDALRTASGRPTRLEFALRRAVLLRLLALLGGGALLVLAWPGWLQAWPYELRRVDWAVRPDPTLLAVAREVQGIPWGDSEGGYPVFTSHPDVGAYLAWCCVDVRSTIDPRLNLYRDSIPQYLAHCAALNPHWGPPGKAAADGRMLPPDTIWVLYDPDIGRGSGVFAGPVFADLADSRPVFKVCGKAVLVYPGVRANANDLANTACPGVGPPESGGAYPAPPTFKQSFLRPPPERSPEADAALMYLRYFDEVARQRQGGRHGNPVAAPLAGAAAAAAGHDAVSGAAQILTRLVFTNLFIPLIDPGPPEAALLALRAARRALARNPNDARAWLALGQAELSLKLRTREGAWAEELPPLALLRHVQIATALENALRLDPDLIPAHRTLANLYTEREFYDLALERRRREVELTRAAGPAPGEKRDSWAAELDAAEKRLREMEKQVQDRLNQYVVQVGNIGSKPLEQARTALRLGLARKALDDVLLRSDVRLFGIEGAQLQLHLLLMTGRAAAVRDALAQFEADGTQKQLDSITIPAAPRPGAPEVYRLPAFDWFAALLGAAVGDYAAADRALRALEEGTRQTAEEELAGIRRRLPVLLAAEIGAFAMPDIFIYQMLVHNNRIAEQTLLRGKELADMQRADLRTLAGLLAVERGDIASARQYFEESLSLAPNFAGRAASELMRKRSK